MGWRGFGFVYHSRTIFCRAVPNPNLTIRNFFIAVGGQPPRERGLSKSTLGGGRQHGDSAGWGWGEAAAEKEKSDAAMRTMTLPPESQLPDPMSSARSTRRR